MCGGGVAGLTYLVGSDLNPYLHFTAVKVGQRSEGRRGRRRGRRAEIGDFQIIPSPHLSYSPNNHFQAVSCRPW